MTTVDVLIKARALVAQGWAQGAEALDKNGCAVSHTAATAVAWCLDGALTRASRPTSRNWILSYWPARAAVKAFLAGQNRLAGWNDDPERTQADVLALLDAAIAAEGGAS